MKVILTKELDKISGGFRRNEKSVRSENPVVVIIGRQFTKSR